MPRTLAYTQLIFSLLGAVGCSRRDARPPAVGVESATPAPPAEAAPVDPPADPASQPLCYAACTNVGKITAESELRALSALNPELIPPDLRPIRDNVGQAAAVCAADCVRSTPRALAECLKAATSAQQVETCLR